MTDAIAGSTHDPSPEPGGGQADRSTVTGHPVVDQVLATLADLEDLPVAEHVAVFESADRRLREALSGADVASPQEPGRQAVQPSTGDRR